MTNGSPKPAAKPLPWKWTTAAAESAMKGIEAILVELKARAEEARKKRSQ